jgi:cytochrome c-type biogenesis protein CcmH
MKAGGKHARRRWAVAAMGVMFAAALAAAETTGVPAPSAAGAAPADAAQTPADAAQTPADETGAVDAHGELRDPGLESRYEHITAQLRCLVCQNESIADSNVELASQLRRQVREMLIGGRTDDDIFKFMTDRYGEFVRFSPPLEAKTLLIWGAPFLMLIVCAVVVLRIARQRARQPLDEAETPTAGAP